MIHKRCSPLIDDPLDVGDGDVLALGAEFEQQIEACDRRGSGPGCDDFRALDFLAGEFEPVQHRRADNDRGAMLVVMEDRDVHAFAAAALDLETFRRLDVFEIDAAECRLERGDDVNKTIDIGLGDFDVEYIDAGEFLEQNRFAFHHRFRGKRADIAETENRRTVRQDGDQVLANGQARRFLRILRYRQASGGNAGRISKRKVALGGERLRRLDFQLSRLRIAMIGEGAGFEVGCDVVCHGGSAFVVMDLV